MPLEDTAYLHLKTFWFILMMYQKNGFKSLHRLNHQREARSFINTIRAYCIYLVGEILMVFIRYLGMIVGLFILKQKNGTKLETLI